MGYVVETKMECFALEEDDDTIIIGYYDNEGDDAMNPACPTDTIVIPRGILSIAEEAFKDKSLISVTLSPTLTSIEDFAFQGNALTSVTFFDSVVTVGHGAFVYNSLTSAPVATNVVIEDYMWKTTSNACFDFHLYRYRYNC